MDNQTGAVGKGRSESNPIESVAVRIQLLEYKTDGRSILIPFIDEEQIHKIDGRFQYFLATTVKRKPELQRLLEDRQWKDQIRHMSEHLRGETMQEGEYLEHVINHLGEGHPIPLPLIFLSINVADSITWECRTLPFRIRLEAAVRKQGIPAPGWLIIANNGVSEMRQGRHSVTAVVHNDLRGNSITQAPETWIYKHSVICDHAEGYDPDLVCLDPP